MVELMLGGGYVRGKGSIEIVNEDSSFLGTSDKCKLDLLLNWGLWSKEKGWSEGKKSYADMKEVKDITITISQGDVSMCYVNMYDGTETQFPISSLKVVLADLEKYGVSNEKPT